MEEEKDTLTMSPFWDPKRRRLRRSYSLILTSTSLFILSIVIVLVFTLIVVPTLRSLASNIFRPHVVKSGWDFLNLVLVLFAVVCAFLSKNDPNETQTPRFDHENRRSFSNPSTPPPLHWYEYSNNRSFNSLRSFGSYRDLRQHSPWVADDERFRFYDDTHPLLRHRNLTPELEEREFGVENVGTVTYVDKVASRPPPQRSPPSPSPPPETRRKDVRRNVKRIYQVEMNEKPESNDLVAGNSQPPPPSSSPPSQPPFQSPSPAMRRKAVRRNAKRTYQPESDDLVAENSQPPPPQPVPAERMTEIQVKNKRGIGTREFLTSFRGKKKKPRQKSVENFDNILRSEPFPLTSQQPPPPPPPPPPPSVFHNPFSSKKSKHITHYHVPVATYKPLLSNKRDHYSYSLEDNNVMINGNESPLIPIPPPPPPPPFKLPAWKFRVQGDFVRVDSIGSSRSGSPDLDEVVESPISIEETSQCGNSPCAPHGEGFATASATSLFCPSPDVDTKAHNFIESFRAGLRMAKMNSMKEKQGIGRSILGPSPNPQTKNETRLR